MIFNGLPEVLGGIVSGAVKLDAFGDGVPVGEHTSGNRRRSAPAVQGMLPFLLDGEKAVGVAGRSGFFDLGQSLAKFVTGVSDQGLKGTFVGHGDDAAFDAAAEEFASEGLFLRVVEIPTGSLGVDVEKELGKRFEFDEAVNGENHRVAVFGDDRGGSDQGLQGDLLGVEKSGGAENDHEKCGFHRETSYQGPLEILKRRGRRERGPARRA